MAKGLLATGDHFLLEHNSVPGRDLVWSDNSDGSGTNWLGLQLMIIRDELTKKSSWTNFIYSQVDGYSGAPCHAQSETPAIMPGTVLQATQALQRAINLGRAIPSPAPDDTSMWLRISGIAALVVAICAGVLWLR